MKKSRTEERPQPAQIEAIERCIERGKLAEADERLKRLQAAFPNFKPLRRLAYEIARESGDTLRRVFSAWEWCAASPNSTPAFTALAESSGVHFPYLFLHALEQLMALGENPGVDLATVRAALSSDISEDEGRRIDLCQVLLASGKAAEAGALVEHITQVSAQNNFGQALFAQGKIVRAEAVFAAVVESAPENLLRLDGYSHCASGWPGVTPPCPWPIACLPSCRKPSTQQANRLMGQFFWGGSNRPKPFIWLP